MQYFQYKGDIFDCNGEYCIPNWAIQKHKQGILYMDIEQDHQKGEPYILSLKQNKDNIKIQLGDYIVYDNDEICVYRKVK